MRLEDRSQYVTRQSERGKKGELRTVKHSRVEMIKTIS